MLRLNIRGRILLQILLVVVLIAAINNVRVPTEVTAAPVQGCDSSKAQPKNCNTTTTTTIFGATTTTTQAAPQSTVPSGVTPGAGGNGGGQGNGGGPPTTTTVTTTTVVDSTTTTEPAPSTTEPAPTTTRAPRVTTAPAPIPQPTSNNLVDLQIDRTNREPYVVTINSLNGVSGSSIFEASVSSRMTQVAADLGYVSVRITALDATRAPVQSLQQVTQIRMGGLPVDGVVAISDDEVIWKSIPRLTSLSLTADQQVGYFVDANSSVVILTKKSGSLGIRKQRPPLSIQQWATQMTPGSATRLQVDGQIGEDPVLLSTVDSGIACQVSDVGVLSAIESGLCSVSAVQGGGSMYMSAVAETRVAEVSLLSQIRDTVVEYRTSLSMLTLVILLVMFLLWQFAQTVVQIRQALRTDPDSL